MQPVPHPVVEREIIMTHLLDGEAMDKLVSNISRSFSVLCEDVGKAVALNLENIATHANEQIEHPVRMHRFGKYPEAEDNGLGDAFSKVYGASIDDNAILRSILDSLGRQAGLHGVMAPEVIEETVVREFAKLHSIIEKRRVALDYINRNFSHETKQQMPCQLPNTNHDPLICRTCVAHTALAQTDRGTGQ